MYWNKNKFTFLRRKWKQSLESLVFEYKYLMICDEENKIVNCKISFCKDQFYVFILLNEMTQI